MITTAAQESKPKDENSYRKMQNVVTDCTVVHSRRNEWKLFTIPKRKTPRNAVFSGFLVQYQLPR
jgi:hypothetical protein